MALGMCISRGCGIGANPDCRELAQWADLLSLADSWGPDVPSWGRKGSDDAIDAKGFLDWDEKGSGRDLSHSWHLTVRTFAQQRPLQSRCQSDQATGVPLPA